MARRKRKAPRRKMAPSLLNILESYTYASILTKGLANTTPLGMITGSADLIPAPATGGIANLAANYGQFGQDVVSLGDIIQNPGLSVALMTQNARSNIIPMAMASFATGITFRLGKRLLRAPISNVNRNIMAPIFGKGASGVRL
jgi:hypothetical protein